MNILIWRNADATEFAISREKDEVMRAQTNNTERTYKLYDVVDLCDTGFGGIDTVVIDRLKLHIETEEISDYESGRICDECGCNIEGNHREIVLYSNNGIIGMLAELCYEHS